MIAVVAKETRYIELNAMWYPQGGNNQQAGLLPHSLLRKETCIMHIIFVFFCNNCFLSPVVNILGAWSLNGYEGPFATSSDSWIASVFF